MPTEAPPDDLRHRLPMVVQVILADSSIAYVACGSGSTTFLCSTPNQAAAMWRLPGAVALGPGAWGWPLEWGPPSAALQVPCPLPSEAHPDAEARGYRLPEDKEPRDFEPHLVQVSMLWWAYGFGACLGDRSEATARARWRHEATWAYVRSKYGQKVPSSMTKFDDYEAPLTEPLREETDASLCERASAWFQQCRPDDALGTSYDGAIEDVTQVVNGMLPSGWQATITSVTWAVESDRWIAQAGSPTESVGPVTVVDTVRTGVSSVGEKLARGLLALIRAESPGEDLDARAAHLHNVVSAAVDPSWNVSVYRACDSKSAVVTAYMPGHGLRTVGTGVDLRDDRDIDTARNTIVQRTRSASMQRLHWLPDLGPEPSDFRGLSDNPHVEVSLGLEAHAPTAGDRRKALQHELGRLDHEDRCLTDSKASVAACMRKYWSDSHAAKLLDKFPPVDEYDLLPDHDQRKDGPLPEGPGGEP